MRASHLDHWTRELVRCSLEMLRGSVADFRGDPALLVDLTRRTRQVLGEQLPSAAAGQRDTAVLSEELAMAVYLTVAADGPNVELTPDLLPDLSLGLARTLRSLHSADAQGQSQGGVE